MYLIHLRNNLNLMFVLNVGIIYLCEFLVLIKIMTNDEGFTIYSHVHILQAKRPLIIKRIIKMT
jgi:hypothetical protein